MSNILLTKLLLGPGLVVAASLAGRRWGPAVSGILVAIPIVLGPILLIITIEHGEAFGADTATSSLLALVALAVYTWWCSSAPAGRAAGRSRRWRAGSRSWRENRRVPLRHVDASPVVALVLRPARSRSSST